VGSLDPAKLLVILVVALIVVGPERLPRLARQLGAAWHELTKVREQVREEVRAALPSDALAGIPSPSQAVADLVTGLRGEGWAIEAPAPSTSEEDDPPAASGSADDADDFAAEGSDGGRADPGTWWEAVVPPGAPGPYLDDPSMN
jgi:Sec-independent protein translocase protein TatA